MAAPPAAPGRAQRSRQPDVLLSCPRCGGRELTAARIGMRLRAGKATGGTPVYLCTLCLMQGQRVVVA